MSLPVQLELEYMLMQRRFAQAPGGQLDMPRLRMRLRQIAEGVASQKVAELTELFGKPVRLHSRETINQWVNTEAEAARDYVARLHDAQDGRQDAERNLIDIMRAAIRGQQESRASSALLTLNTELIEEAARGGGSSHYSWRTQMDDRVRAWHAKLQGSTQAWDKPPTGGGTHSGDTGHPGSGYGCRCYPVPIHGTTTTRRPRRSIPTGIPANVVTRVQSVPGKELNTGYKGRLKPGMALDEAEDAIRSYKTEHAMAWDRDGKSVLRVTQRNKKKFTITTAQMREAVIPRVDTLTHNHPNGIASLSVGDIKLARSGKIRRYRSTTSSGSGMELLVTDERLFSKRQPISLNRLLADAEGRARQFAGDAAYEYAYIKRPDGIRIVNPARTPAGEYKAWSDAYTVEAEKLYNEVGERFGFTVKAYKK